MENPQAEKIPIKGTPDIVEKCQILQTTAFGSKTMTIPWICCIALVEMGRFVSAGICNALRSSDVLENDNVNQKGAAFQVRLVLPAS